MARRLIRTELWTDLVSAGGAAAGAIPVRSVRTSFAVEGTGQQCVLTLGRRATILAQLTARRVVRLVFADGSFEEWRIQRRERTHGKGDTATVICIPLAQADLAEGNVIASTDSVTGLLVQGGGLVGRTASDYIDTYVLQALSAVGLTMYARGTVTPTLAFDLNWADAPTPRDFLNRIRDALRSRGVRCEWTLRQNGTSGYYIDVLTAIGGSAPTLELRLGKKLQLPLTLIDDATEQATRVLAYGKEQATMAHARWRIDAIDSANRKLTLVDPAGGAGPISFDEQHVGWYLYRERTGGTFQIQHAWSSTQQVQVPYIGTLAVGEMVGLRITEPETGTFVVDGPLGGTATPVFRRVSAVSGTGVTIANDFNITAADPVSSDGQYADRALHWATEQVAGRSCTNGNIVGSYGARVAMAGGNVAGIAVGDYVFFENGGTSGTPPPLPANPYCPWGRVVAVGAAAAGEIEVLNLATGDTTNMVFTQTSQVYAWVYRPQSTVRRIQNATASSNTLTLDSAGPPVTAAVWIENRYGRGTRPYLLTHPTRDLRPANGGAGPKLATITRELVSGLANLAPNAFMRTWTNAANPPESWGPIGPGFTGAKNTDPLYTALGGASWKITSSGGPTAATRTVADLPSIVLLPPVAGMRVSVRVRMLIASSWSGNQSIQLQLVGTGATLTNNTATCYPLDHPTAPGNQKVAAGQWVDLAVENLDVGLAGLTGITPRLIQSNATGVAMFGVLYLDAILAVEGDTAPAELEEYGGANVLWQSANRVLEMLSDTPISVDLTLRQLQTIDPTITEADVVLGQMVRVIDPELPLDTTARIQTLEYQDWPRTAASPRLTVATRPPLFTDLVALT